MPEKAKAEKAKKNDPGSSDTVSEQGSKSNAPPDPDKIENADDKNEDAPAAELSNCERCLDRVYAIQDKYPKKITHVLCCLCFFLGCPLCIFLPYCCIGEKVKRCPRCGYFVDRPCGPRKKKPPQSPSQKSKKSQTQ